jgi:hypothetical protein
MSATKEDGFNLGLSLLDACFVPTPGKETLGVTELRDQDVQRLKELGWTVDGDSVSGHGWKFPLKWKRILS